MSLSLSPASIPLAGDFSGKAFLIGAGPVEKAAQWTYHVSLEGVCGRMSP